MKEFNETMIKNYRELNNCGTFEIDGYAVKFDNHSKTLETEYPYAEDLRLWWFDIEQESKETEKKIKFILEHGFEDVTKVAIEELSKKTTKVSKFVLDRMERANQHIYKKDNVVIVYGKWVFPVREKNQLSKIYKCTVKCADKYFNEMGEWRTWIHL
jgi:hypothetical protein